MVFLSRAKSKGQCPDMGFGQYKAQKGRGAFRGEERSLGNSGRSVIIIGCPSDGIGLFLVVHLQHIIHIFDCSGRGTKENGVG